MLFVQLDANWADHPKVIEVGLDGAGLHAMAMCLAKRMDTDGVLHRSQLRRLGASDELVDRLISAGLLDALDDQRVRVHGWLDRNPSQEAIARGSREGNHKRWNHEGPVEACPKCNKGAAKPPEKNPSPVPISSPVDPPGIGRGSPVESEAILESESESESESEITPSSTKTSTAWVTEVFTAWQEATGKRRAVLDPKRRRLIRRALDQYPLADVLDAVKGWKHSPHHRGENQRHTVYNDLELLLRDAAHIERFRDLERDGPPTVPSPASSAIATVMAERARSRA